MLKIFIVDDDISILELYKRFLNNEKFKVVKSARNGEEAVGKFQEFLVKPDVILMDYKMPIKDGIEATKEILKVDKNAKIIFVSGDSTIMKKALSNGAIGFIEKPFTIKRFCQEIINIYESYEKNLYYEQRNN